MLLGCKTTMPLSYRLATIIVLFLGVTEGKAFSLPATSSVYGIEIKKDTGKVKKDTAKAAAMPAPPKPFVFKPILGLGTGMFSYFGAVTSMHSQLQNPMTSRLGYELTYAQKLTPIIEFNLYAVFGKLSVNERSTSVNWNFLSEIRGGGLHLLFKILPKQDVTPYILTGVESFEFLSKTDMYDQYGNKYYYWNDGSIRNIAQSAPNAAAATTIYRDYSYESDMRELNIGNTGKYSLQTFTIPFGLGFMFHIGKRADLLLGSTLHYTFTNHIDGYGDSIKSKRNDMFLMTSVSLRVDISNHKKNKEDDNGAYLPETLEGVDFAALQNDDYDRDGVRDWDDSCPGTPKGIPVDVKGCPLDKDHDGVPDYLDKQENSAPGAIVDMNGVALTDSAILMQYLMFEDTTGAFAQIEVQNTINAPPGSAGKNVHYTIQLGRFKKGIPPDVMDKLLSIPDVKSITLPDSSTMYTVGSYNDFSVAQMRQQQLINDGLPDAKVVYKKGKEYVEAKSPVEGSAPANNVPVNGNNPPNNNVPNNGNNPGNNNVPVNGNNPPNNNIPNNGNNPGNNNVPVNGNNPPNNNVPNNGNNPGNNNVPNNGNNPGNNNVPVNGNNPPNNSNNPGNNNVPVNGNNPPNNGNPQANNFPSQGNMVYRIQLGAYSHKLSRDVFSNVDNLVEVKTENGFYTYSAGSYTNYMDAVNYKTQLMTQGFPDAFIKAYKGGKRIPLKDAGATYIQPTKEDLNEQVTHESNTLDKSQITFKVQVGVFRGSLPEDKAARFKSMTDLTTDRDSSGLTHYLVGSYTDFETAKKMRDKLASEPVLKDCFIVSYFKDKPIPLDQALSIMKK